MRIVPWARKRLLLPAAVSTLLAMTASLLVAGPAQAAVDSVTCPLGSFAITYSPPLTNQPQDVNGTVDAKYGSCVSASHPALTSAAGTGGTFPLDDRSCLELLGRSTRQFTVIWNTGQTTTFRSISNGTIVGAVYTVTSELLVVDGLFLGHTGVANYTGPAAEILACTLGLGTVDKVELVANLQILPL